MALGEISWVRDLDGKPAVFVNHLTDTSVLISTGSRRHALEKSDWLALPLWKGPMLTFDLSDAQRRQR